MDVAGAGFDCAGNTEVHKTPSTEQSSDTRRVTHKPPLNLFMFEANGP
jgi:hypothetical protein